MEIIIYDITGKALLQMPVTGRRMNLYPSGSSFAGIFFYRIVNRERVMIDSGKISMK